MSGTDALQIQVDAREALQRQGYLRSLIAKPSVVLALIWILLVAVCAVLAAQIAPYDPIDGDLAAILELPSGAHLLGTDQLGRDVLSRLIWGAGDTLGGALTAVVVAVAIGVPLGVAAGYFGGLLYTLTSRLADLLLTVPSIIVMLTVLAVFGNGMYIAMVALGVLLSASFMRLSAAATKAVGVELFVDAARVFGVRDIQILVKHVLPNMIAPIVIQASITLGLALLIQAGLSFLGLGTRPPFPSWGQMVAEASQQIYGQPWLMVPSGLVIVLTTLAFTFIGDAARDALPQSDRGNLLASAPRRPAVGSGKLAPAASDDVALAVRDLRVSFPVGDGSVDVVRGVSFEARRGTTLGLVGESGSGKTMTAMAILGLVPAPGSVSAGSVLFDGHDLAAEGEQGYRGVRGRRIALVSQEPMVALDPCFTVRTHLRGPLMRFRGMSRRDADAEALRLLGIVGMRDPKAVLASYPHQLSGGMAQRVAIAWALAGDPEVLIADEPTTALDVTVEAGILDLLRSIQASTGMTILLVTHDLGVVADICDDVVVMRDGEIVEQAPAERIFEAPQHEYSESLLRHARAFDRDLGAA